jgi:hypothetical protein
MVIPGHSRRQIVIARSVSDEAIQSPVVALDCFARNDGALSRMRAPE